MLSLHLIAAGQAAGWPIAAGAGLGLGVFLCALLLAWSLTARIRRWALATGFVDSPNAQKFHRDPMPYGGGLAIFLAFWVTLGLGVAAGALLHRAAPAWLPAELARHLPGMVSRLPQLAALFAGGVAILVLGYVDDRRKLGPLPKLAVELLVAIGVAACGLRITLFLPVPAVSWVLTVAWIVLVTNSINLLDNMDGLAAGVAAVAAGVFLLVAVQFGQWFVCLYLVALIGALAGFLRHNYPPASIFMGDAGSLTIGYLLSTLTIAATFYQPGRLYSVILPLLVLAVPLFDTASVVVLRWRMGRPIYVGDTNHFSHRLVRMGLSPRRAVQTIWLLTLVSGLGASLLYQVNETGALLVLAQTLLLLGLVALLERESRLAREGAEKGHDAQTGAASGEVASSGQREDATA